MLLFLNYSNLLPLSKTFPILSFLPHQTKLNESTIMPSPTPALPFVVKKVDPIKKTGEFIINNPTPKKSTFSLEKQMVINGTYQIDNKKITIQPSVENSSIPIHPMPQEFIAASDIVLRFEMVADKKSIYRTVISLNNPNKIKIVPFSVRIPFYSPATIKIYSGSGELLSQEVNL